MLIIFLNFQGTSTFDASAMKTKMELTSSTNACHIQMYVNVVTQSLVPTTRAYSHVMLIFITKRTGIHMMKTAREGIIITDQL